MLQEGMFDASGGVRLHYIDWGGEGRSIVLLSGIGGTAQLYRGLAPLLAGRFRVAALTRRGHGRSDRPASGYDIDTAVNDILRFLDHLGIDRAVLIGHSWAGLEIPRFCALHPDRVEATVYLDALSVFYEPLPDWDADPVWSTVETEPQPADLASSNAYLDFVKRSRPDIAAVWCEAVEADRRDMIRQVVRHGPFEQVQELMHAGLGEHRHPRYEDTGVPALAIIPAGKNHPFTTPTLKPETQQAMNAFYAAHVRPWVLRRADRFLAAVPGGSIVELDTSNHAVFVAKESETAAAILDWLSPQPGNE